MKRTPTTDDDDAAAGTDVLIIGGGAAGLTLALRLADSARVTVLSKGGLREGATFYAQGGIAAALDPEDSFAAHAADTMAAGAGLCRRPVVEHVVANGPAAVAWLLEQGAPFSRGPAPAGAADASGLASLRLAREGGHSRRRIVHAADATGKAVFETLSRRAGEHPGIRLLEGRAAVDVVVRRPGPGPERACAGAYAFNLQTRRVEAIPARFVALATGGASKAYLYTTNPDGATGDGIAMAWRAGCRVANMEFNQFHPTCLYHPHAKSFLITEALRGEGARLELPDGDRFMRRFDERGELAPRDIVARAIDHEMKRIGCDCVFLDITHKSAAFLRARFPTIRRRCLEFGIDIAAERIPVVPAAHYTCGGVVVNERGETDLDGLYAVGETSCSGLHGANRMASNSLLECLVVAFGAADSIRRRLAEARPAPSIAPWDESRVTESDDEVLVSHNWDEIRRLMWDFVGIVRNDRRLERARRRIRVIREEVRDHYVRHRVTRDNLELRNLALVAELIVRCASRRRESRGLHYTLDCPETGAEAADTVLTPGAR